MHMVLRCAYYTKLSTNGWGKKGGLLLISERNKKLKPLDAVLVGIELKAWEINSVMGYCRLYHLSESVEKGWD